MTPEDLEEEDEGWVGLARVEALSPLSPTSEQAECGLVRAAGGCHWAHGIFKLQFAVNRIIVHSPQAPPWDFPGKRTGVCCHFLLQGVFLTQESNLRLLHWQADSLPLSHQRSPDRISWLPK